MREIRMTVYAGLLKKNSNLGGAQGEGNVTDLLIEFRPEWDGTTKTITFYDANMENPVQVTLTTALLEDAAQDIRTYRVPIPSEPLAIAGQMTFTIDGYVSGSRARTAQDTLIVLPSPMVKDPSAITPTQAEQLQAGIDAVLEDIAGMETAIANEAGREAAEEGRRTAEQARVAAEQGRATAEQSRAFAEDTRVSQETARQDAEAERQAAEQARVDTDTGIVAQATQQATAAGQSANAAAGSAQTAAQQAALAQQAAGSAATAAASQLTGQMAGYVSDAQEAAQDAADAATAISAYGTEVPVTLTAAGWTGAAVPYAQTVAVAGLLANSYGDIGPANSATAAQRAAYRSALIAVTAQADGSVTLVADGDKPAVDIPAVVRFGGVLDTGGGGGAYTLPAATADTLGGIKVGTGLSVEADGTLLTFTGAVTGEYDGSAAKTINIPSGGGAEQLVVTFSESGSNWVSNRTFAEVRAAMDAGTPVIGYVASSHRYYALTAYNPNADYDYIEFALNYGHWVERFVLNETNEVSHEDVDLESDHLPYVTASDDGKLLQVVNGAWAAATIENAAGGSY